METSTGTYIYIIIKIGVILSADYITQLSKAIREVGGLFILDGIAAGSIWVDMEKWDVDVYISAP